MSEGYQIIGLTMLESVTSSPKRQDMTVALLSWLIELIRKDLGRQLAGAKLKLIRAEYHGAYPTIGIDYDEAAVKFDREHLVDAAVSRVLRERNAVDFIEWLINSDVDWKSAARELLGSAVPSDVD